MGLWQRLTQRGGFFHFSGWTNTAIWCRQLLKSCLQPGSLRRFVSLFVVAYRHSAGVLSRRGGVRFRCNCVVQRAF